MRPASQHVDSFDVDLALVSLHALSPVAHTELDKEPLNRREAVVVGLKLEFFGQRLQTLPLDEGHEVLKFTHLENLGRTGF